MPEKPLQYKYSLFLFSLFFSVTFPAVGAARAAAPASAAAGALAAAAAAAVGQTRKHDQGDDYPDETFIVPEEIAKAVHNTTSL